MFRSLLLAAMLLVSTSASPMGAVGAQDDFPELKTCKLSPTGRNEYFILEPGYQLQLEGGGEKLHITVLDETKVVAGVTTRVVEEREWKGDKLYEVSRNYFAICPESRNVYYFGEHVEFYDDKGKVTKTDGTWIAGENGNRPGLIMPGKPQAKMKYFQEVAPGVAMDHATIESLDETCTVPAGTFKRCLKVREGSSIEVWAKEYKYHAPGVGLIQDEDLKLVKHGFINKK
ncbi:MAG TPA: hypothetical protein VD965_08205 [Burkholderiales bacterium]|nr:hypothetical protein [Burkholderiales bacterium]